MTSFYDVVVIGDELAGAVAGGHLARRGFRVLMLCAPPVEREAIGPYQVPAAPLTLTNLESPALKRLVEDLNLLQVLRRRVEANEPAFQLLLPDHRLDVSPTDLPRELARELPEEAAAWDAWSARAATVSETLAKLLVEDVTLPPDGFWARRDLKRMAAQLPPDAEEPALPPESRMLAYLPARFGCDLDAPGAIALARLSDQYRRGTWSIEGGRDTLRTMLHERIRTYGGEVRHDLLRGLAVRRGRIQGVAIGHREEVVGCTQVIAAMPASEVVKLLPEAPPRRLAEAAALPAPHHRYLLHLVAPLPALPDALGRLAFSIRDVRTWLEGGNLFALHTTPGHAQYAVLTVEALSRETSAPGLAKLRASLRAHLDQIFPFLDRHLLAVWSPHDGVAPEGPRGSIGEARAPQPMTAIWNVPAPRALGICGLPHASGIKGLWLANRQVIPGLGFEGELLTGWGAARLTASTDKRRAGNAKEILGT